VFGVGVLGFLDELLLDSVVKLCCPRQFENSGLCVQEDGRLSSKKRTIAWKVGG
jgi:hypothetical protein